MPSPDEVRRLLYPERPVLTAGAAPALPAQNGARPEPEPERIIDVGLPAETVYEPFPLDALPVWIADYGMEAARAMQVEPEIVILPSLACLGAAIGNSRRIELKYGYSESAAVWPVIVARPGSVKTAAVNAAAQPLQDYERQLDTANRKRAELYERELSDWDGAKRIKDFDRGPRPPEPTTRRQVIHDSTMEELAYIMSDNPRGLLMLQDEISAWIRGMNQYKAGGKGSDRAKWLSVWSGVPFAVDRRSAHGKPLRVWDPFVCVTGGIQPDLLRELRPEKGQDDGFMDRLLFAWPPQRERLWTEATVARMTEDAYRFLFADLLSLTMDQDEISGIERPRLIGMDAGAHDAWVEHFNAHHREMAGVDFDPRLHGAYAKLDVYAARFALIVHLTRVAGREIDDLLIDQDSMTAAWALVSYFKSGARRVYGEMSLTPDDHRVQDVLAWLGKHKVTELSARDCTTYKVAGAHTLTDVRSLFAAMKDRGYGTFVEESGGRGRKRLIFRLNPSEWKEAAQDD